MPLIPRFRTAVAALELGSGVALVAVSGGPDSVAMLDLLVATADAHGLTLVVAHVDHGIHAESASVARRVELLAESYGLQFTGSRLALGGGASETIAREARHAALAEAARRASASHIFMAHHADDQAETVLMRVLNGSGPAGLAAMAPKRGRIVRPLLTFRRAELAQYLHGRRLDAWIDPANADPAHLRSWLRTEVMPALTMRIPGAARHLVRSASLAEADRRAWDAVLDVLPALETTLEPGAISVAAGPLAGYDSSLAEAIVSAAARRAGCTAGPARAKRLVALARAGVSGRTTPLGRGWAGELAFGRVRIGRVDPAPPVLAISVAGEGSASWGGWSLRWTLGQAPARQERRSLDAWMVPAAFTVRSPRPGDRVSPIRGNGKRLLVRCFQDARIPRLRRAAWPVLEADGVVAWVPGVCRSDTLIPEEGAEALRVEASYG